MLRTALRILLPLAVLALAVGAAMVAIATRPGTDRRPPPQPLTTVEAFRVHRQSMPVFVRSQGTVQPRTETTLMPEVTGRIVAVAPAFRDGGFFEQGEELVTLDPRDHEIAVTVAKARLAEARVALEEERARAEQARRDWERLGQGGEPGALVLREPQLRNAEAAVASARAQLAQAELDLARTHITAPYAGRILEKHVDVGQYVSPGTALAELYAVDYVEIPLPLSNEQLAFVEVPETFRGDEPGERPPGPPVTLSARVGAERHTWQGRIVRARGAIDVQTRQLFVVAQVDNPYGRRGAGNPPLKVGQFVEARIEGRTLKDVFVIPRATLREGNFVLIADADDRLQRVAVEIAWSDPDRVAVRGGLTEGQRLVLTPVTYAVNGAPVAVQLLDGDGERQAGSAGAGAGGVSAR